MTRDNDTGPNSSSIRYLLVESPYTLPFGISNGLHSFTINPVSGLIVRRSSTPLNPEMTAQFLLTIRASDMGKPSLFELHTLNLILVPTLSLHELPGALRIDEELPLGTVLARLTCEEIGPPTYSTSIALSSQSSNLLRIVERSNLIVAESIDYESLPDSSREFNITATCSNRFEQTDSIVITVIINNINDNVFEFEHLQHTLVVSENLTIGEEVLMVSAGDRDLPDANITYSLEPASDFTITPHTGEIVSHSSLDRETQALYHFTVYAAYTNMTGLVERTSSSVTIHIADVNDESPIFEQSVYSIRNVTDTNEPGDLVLIVSASDSDAGSGGTVTYHFSEESSNFEINETTGAIFISSFLTDRLYVLNITAIDGGEDPMSSSALVFIHSSLTHIFVIDEDAPIGSVIGNVSYAVLDNSNATPNDTSRVGLLFEIVNASVPFGINATTGEIHTLGSLDYETRATQYDFTVRATLFAPTRELVDQIVVRIIVENVDDESPMFSMTYNVITEQFTGPNITILSVSVIDLDALNNIEYSLSVDNSSLFQIDPLTGEISATELLDVPKDYRFTVIAIDSGAHEANTSVFISVSAVPVFITEDFNFFLSESAPPGTIIGRVTDGFEDDTGEIAFLVGVPDVESITIFTNISEGIFHIDATSGNISTLDMVDHESIEDYVFSVAMYNVNTGTVYYTATVVVQIEDENDNPPVFMPSHYTRAIGEETEPDSILTVVSATDRDAGSNGRVTYFFSEESMVPEFVLNSTSGEISTSNLTLLPGLYNLTVVASDEGSPPLRAETTVFIDVIQFVPEAIEFSKQAYNFQVAEMAPPGTLVGVVQATEFNSSLTPPSLTYSWPNITDCFSIDTQSGEIRVSCASLDRESVGDYELVVTAEVENVTTYAIINISVLDINDNTPEFSLDVYTEIINSTSNFTNAILQLHAVDRDLDGTVVYNIVSETDEDIFWINSTSGEIFLVDDLLVEVGDYVLVVRATDMGTPVSMSSNASVFIHITNPHPQTLRFASLFLNISENTSANSSVGFVILETNEGEIVDPLDFPNDLYFSIIGGDSPGLFSVDEYTGEIRIQMTLDHEAAVTHVIEIQANFTRFDDVPIQSITASFAVTVVDENDNAPWILQPRSNATTIDDNADGNQVLFNITAIDIDSVPNAMVSFSVDSPAAFAVRVTGTRSPFTFGEIFVNDTDSLVVGVYRFTLTATDSGTPPMQNTTMVTVIVQHAIPEMIHFSSSNYTFSVLEETPEGTPVGNISVLPDTPALDGLVYAITGGSGREFFSIDVATGEIQKLHRRIDRERNSMFQLDLQAFLPEQDASLNTTATVTIIIEDVNDNVPVFSESVYPTIGVNTDELSTAIPLITVSATDRDTGSNADLWYSISSITSDFNYTFVLFSLNGSTGELFPASEELMFGNYTLSIAGRDQGQPPLTGYTSVTIVVQRPAPTSISFTNPGGYTFSLQEQSGAATFAQVMLSRIPEYLLQYVRYSTRGDIDIFLIDSTNGSISAQRDFDYEVDEREFSFEVMATLAVTHRIPPITLVTLTNVTVDIVDINDHSPYFINFPTEISQYEGATRDEEVYSFLAYDDDSGSNSELRYGLLSSTFNNTLTVNQLSGQLIASVNLDREGLLQDAAHDLIIQVCDGGSAPRCVVNTTLFRLLDVNDNPPLLRSGFTYNASERIAEQTQVFSFVGMDPDAGTNGTIRYYLNSTTPFTCNETTGQVSLTRELDYEAQASYRLELTLTDMGDPSLSSFYDNISISVTNLPDNSPYFNQTSYSHAISATASADEVLFRVQATDADIGSSNDSLRYAITNIQVSRNNGDYPRLEVSANTGEIASDALQVFTPGAEFVISILAYDQSAFNLTNVTTLVIRVLHNSLAFTDIEYSVRVLEDVPLGSLIARLDLDPLSVTPDVRYAFNMIEPALPPSLIPFNLSSNGTSVLLTLDWQGHGLNRELIDRYVMEVTASQQNENARTTLQVAVADVNDNSPMLVDPPGTVIWISQDTALHTPVARVNATDPDSGENSRLDFDVVDHNLNIPFEINQTTGVIRTISALDTDEVLPSYDITVYVRDAGQPRLEAHITYTINIGSSPESTELSTTTVLIVVLVGLVGLLITSTAVIIILIVAMIRNKKR